MEKRKFRKPKEKKNMPEKAYVSGSSFQSDPQGSYTGRPADGETPVQDADDL